MASVHAASCGRGRRKVSQLQSDDRNINDLQVPIYCEKDFGVAELQMPAGASAGAYCPHCGGRVLLFFPYGQVVAIISFLIAIGALAVLHVRSIAGFVVGTILIWIHLSLYLRLMSARYRPPILNR